MSPTLPLRVFLWLLNRQSRKARRQRVLPQAGEVPVIPAPRPSDEILARIRRITGKPSFPQRLSSLRIRTWREIRIPGADGTRLARLYRPRGRVNGVVLFLHGGGFVHCDLISHHGICCRLAASSGAMILSLDYRLSPEHRFPAGLEDAWTALQWLRVQFPDLPLAVAGDSAGGNLSAALSQLMREKGERLAGQLLYYPALSGPVAPPSREKYAEGYMLGVELLHWYCGQLLSTPEELFDPRFAPVLAEHFDGLPPTMIVTAGFDPLKGEGELYAQLLQRAGVNVRYRCYPRMIHGFLNFYAFVKEGRSARREGGGFLKRGLEAGNQG
ncbi:alpha/beta hydrolase [Gluconobacter wancherniae]|uniref:alpha/beta hydrolase n=1 Tax=Gluconobacter wancherniae TaxID=1307955 RepID=UPI00309F3A15